MSLPPYLQPGDKVVLYDQHCRFCTLWSGFLARRADHRLRLLAAQSAEGLAILDWFGLAPDHFDTWLFVDGAYACDDNDALLEVLRLLPGPWRHLRWLRLLPAWLRDECHEALRRNRWRPPAPAPSSSLLASPSSLTPLRAGRGGLCCLRTSLRTHTCHGP
ncbi:thiol-disulfide oxidoreductase DCC family protein [Pseudomonas aeruginosa]|uniref:thiol-disulfide oxidoreductase DCC family protein n=3 Tax=Pseudomonas aeruginosa TaxID=287 RepID=UPI0022386879|nr:thiol-disulfide oxidoreductase DCC family protein [Pseudomonas aeruginosa]MCW5312090.1 thiol-disulfide oxidoreductase DCC family protein [Pseudomonas aeruginosa]